MGHAEQRYKNGFPNHKDISLFKTIGNLYGQLGTGDVLLGLGANVKGAWGVPSETLARACTELASADVRPVSVSYLYETPPLGPIVQPNFVNCVLVATVHLPPLALLSVLKSIERRAGRRGGVAWGPRPLDIDVLDYKKVVGTLRGRAAPGRKAELVLPHPELHRRAFVLWPLMDVAPRWHHPVYGLTAKMLLARLEPHKERLAPVEITNRS